MMKVSLQQFFCIPLLVCLVSCSNDNKQSKDQSDDIVLHPIHINKDTINSSYKYYLTSSLKEIKKQAWERVVIDTINDEFNKWIEAKFYYSTNEWIKIEAEDEDNVSISSIMTNSNYFLKESPIKIGDDISLLILKDSTNFNFDEGKMNISAGSYEIKSKCIDDVSDLEYDKILEAREVQNKELLPNRIKACRVTFIRISNVQ